MEIDAKPAEFDEEIINDIDINLIDKQTFEIRNFPSLQYQIEHSSELTAEELMLSIGVMQTKVRLYNLSITALKKELKKTDIKKNPHLVNNIKNEISMYEKKIKSRTKVIELFCDEHITRFLLNNENNNGEEKEKTEEGN